VQIRFRCDLCNQALRAKEELSGKKIRCPKCHALLLVPAPPKKPKEMEGALEITIEERELGGKGPAKPAEPIPKPQPPVERPPAGEKPSPPPGPPPKAPKEEVPAPEAGEIIPFLDQEPTETIAQKMIRETEMDLPSGRPPPKETEKAQRRAGPPRPKAKAVPSARCCPKCKKPYPESVKICVNCGIYIDDGLPVGFERKKLEIAAGPEGLPRDIGLWKLVWLVITRPFQAMESLIGYASKTDMLAKMVGFYFLSLALFLLPGLPAVTKSEVEWGGIPAYIAAGILLILANVILTLFWAVGMNILGRLFGSLAGGTFLAILVALIFIKGVTGISVLVVFLVANTGLMGGGQLMFLMSTLTTLWPFFLYILAAHYIYDIDYFPAFIVVLGGMILGFILLLFTSCIAVGLGISGLSLALKG